MELLLHQFVTVTEAYTLKLHFILLYVLTFKIWVTLLQCYPFSPYSCLTFGVIFTADTFSLPLGLIELNSIFLCVLEFCFGCQILGYFMTVLPLLSLHIFVFDF